MDHNGDWQYSSSPWESQTSGFSPLRVALLFGSVAIALALLATPFLDRSSRNASLAGQAAGLDTMSTGSLSAAGRNGANHRERYVLRRSVLQSSPDAVCVIRQDGSRSGDC